MPVNSHIDERLARLLRLLRPTPDGWVAKAQRTLLDMIVRDDRVLAETVLTDGDLVELRRRLETDPLFRQRFDADPVAAAEAAGMRELALGLEREMRELVRLSVVKAPPAMIRVESFE